MSPPLTFDKFTSRDQETMMYLHDPRINHDKVVPPVDILSASVQIELKINGAHDGCLSGLRVIIQYSQLLL